MRGGATPNLPRSWETRSIFRGDVEEMWKRDGREMEETQEEEKEKAPPCSAGAAAVLAARTACKLFPPRFKCAPLSKLQPEPKVVRGAS